MSPQAHMLGGIDEAGLGPLLGPLVVGGLILAGPAGKSPWQSLQRTFCRKPRSRRDRRIRVDDSKRVKQGSRGLAELERTALTFYYTTHGTLPGTVAELAGAAIQPCDWTLFPWYAELDHTPLPRWNDRDEIELAAHLASRAMAEAGVRCLGYPFRVVDVRSWNALIRKHDNKSLAHFEGTLAVVKSCLRTAHAEREGELADVACTLVIDRQGGRGHYRSLLQRAFPSAAVEILGESAQVSRYRLGVHTELVFAEGGEARAFPTAAASCLAKYVRELFVEQLNAWFVARQPGLKPTAGYYTDGRRFLGEIVDREAVQMDLLVRIR